MKVNSKQLNILTARHENLKLLQEKKGKMLQAIGFYFL
jgi:hypothetical protein